MSAPAAVIPGFYGGVPLIPKAVNTESPWRLMLVTMPTFNRPYGEAEFDDAAIF